MRWLWTILAVVLLLGCGPWQVLYFWRPPADAPGALGLFGAGGGTIQWVSDWADSIVSFPSGWHFRVGWPAWTGWQSLVIPVERRGPLWQITLYAPAVLASAIAARCWRRHLGWRSSPAADRKRGQRAGRSAFAGIASAVMTATGRMLKSAPPTCWVWTGLAFTLLVGCIPCTLEIHYEEQRTSRAIKGASYYIGAGMLAWGETWGRPVGGDSYENKSRPLLSLHAGTHPDLRHVTTHWMVWQYDHQEKLERVTFGLLAPLALAALLAVWCWLSFWCARLRRRRPGHCRCGYPLVGNTSGVCPECGAALT